MIDRIHAGSLLLGLSSLIGGVYLLAGSGAALSVFGGLLLVSVAWARTSARHLGGKNGDN